MQFSEMLLQIRREFNLTQQEFSRRIYKDQRTISSYERGRIQPPIDFLIELSNEFNLEILVNNQDFNIRRKTSMREQIYNFVVNNPISDDYTMDDLLNYEQTKTKYKEELPSNFDEFILENKLNTENIFSTPPDDRGEIGICFIGNSVAKILFWIPIYTKVDIGDDFNIEIPIDTDLEGKYTYCKNELWIALLQKNIHSATDLELVEALHSSVYSLLVTNDERIYNLNTFDIDELKSYSNDLSKSKETIKAIATVHSGLEEKRIIFELFENDNVSEQEENFNHTTSSILDIPSSEVLLCANNNKLPESLIIVSSNFYKKVSATLI